MMICDLGGFMVVPSRNTSIFWASVDVRVVGKGQSGLDTDIM